MATFHTLILASDFYAVGFWVAIMPTLIVMGVLALLALVAKCYRIASLVGLIGGAVGIRALFDVFRRKDLSDGYSLMIFVVLLNIALLCVVIFSALKWRKRQIEKGE